MSENKIPDNFYDDEDYDDEMPDPNMRDDCPNCGNEYDEIDYEYQICHICKWDRNKNKQGR